MLIPVESEVKIKMDNFTVFSIIITLITICIIVAIFIGYNLVNSNTKKKTKSKYLRNRQIDEKTLKNEEYIMNELMNGEIKCNMIRNNAPSYKVQKWVKEMESFMESSNYNYLMKMEGRNIDDDK